MCEGIPTRDRATNLVRLYLWSLVSLRPLLLLSRWSLLLVELLTIYFGVHCQLFAILLEGGLGSVRYYWLVQSTG